MKKIIALALALIMALSMGSVALADVATVDTCDSTCKVDLTDTDTTVHLLPGERYKVDANLGTSDGDFPDDKDYKVTAEWTKGGALVKGIAWDKKEGDNGAWVLTLNENYTISAAKALKGTLTFKAKGENTADIKITINTVVSNHLVKIEGDEDLDYAQECDAVNNTIYQCDEDCDGFVKFNTNALLSATLNMVSKEKAFMYNDESMIEALEEKFPEADLECYNFGGQPTFKNAAKFTLQADYADQYFIYAYANGKLEAQDAEWDSIEGVYTWSTKSPASYVISDVELVAAADDAATTNPDTGANDVVGVAAALAVVSLVAAGAVSLKK